MNNNIGGQFSILYYLICTLVVLCIGHGPFSHLYDDVISEHLDHTHPLRKVLSCVLVSLLYGIFQCATVSLA